MPGQLVDYYELLQVSRWATPAEIRAAYLNLASRFHPDLNPGDTDAADTAFKRLQEAYEVLLDRDRRASYDAEVLWPAMRGGDVRPVGTGLSVVLGPAGGRRSMRLGRAVPWLLASCLLAAILAIWKVAPTGYAPSATSDDHATASYTPFSRPLDPIGPHPHRDSSERPIDWEPRLASKPPARPASANGLDSPQHAVAPPSPAPPSPATRRPNGPSPLGGREPSTAPKRLAASTQTQVTTRVKPVWIPTHVAAHLDFTSRPSAEPGLAPVPIPQADPPPRRAPDRPWNRSPSLAPVARRQAKPRETAVSFRSSWLWLAQTVALDQRLERRTSRPALGRDLPGRPGRPPHPSRQLPPGVPAQPNGSPFASVWANVTLPGMRTRHPGWPSALQFTTAPPVWPGTHGPLAPQGDAGVWTASTP